MQVARVSAAAVEQERAADDDQFVEIWLHGRSEHTVRAYRADRDRFRVRVGRPLARVTLPDLQQFALAQTTSTAFTTLPLYLRYPIATPEPVGTFGLTQ